MSLYSGVLPNAMKIAKDRPVHKNGASNIFSNYRTISQLPHFSNYLKRYLFWERENLSKKHDILHGCQFGFRGGRSPSMNLLSLIENITTALDAHKHAVGVFMDIKKTYDTIDHNIFL